MVGNEPDRSHVGSSTAVYRSVAGLAAAGNNVVLDDVVLEPDVARLGIGALRHCPTSMIRVSCRTGMSIARERARPDRLAGAVAAYASGAECLDRFDLTVDTSHRSTPSCAAEICRTGARRQPEPQFTCIPSPHTRRAPDTPRAPIGDAELRPCGDGEHPTRYHAAGTRPQPQSRRCDAGSAPYRHSYRAHRR